MQWFVGIQTASRSRSLLDQTLASLRRAGWNSFYIFAEPGVPRPPGTDTLFQTPVNHLGAYANWRRMLATAAKIQADRFLLCQDDIAVWERLRVILEAEISNSGFAIYCPYTTPADHESGGRRSGWFKTERNYYVSGAWMYAMNQDTVKELASLMPPTVPNNKHIDAHLGLLMSLAGHPLYLHHPSLVDHRGSSLSTLGYGGSDNTRSAKDFIGETSQVAEKEEELVPATDYAFLQITPNE